ncbi:MAG: RES domain-containing protein [Proteobacteria bacterium]|nr:RES domain-containing protein [Pseudomonadota bacterium]MCH8951814.1 RES domain-containing protein [Pseudomonadota bacterium]
MASLAERPLWRLVRPDFASGLDGRGAERYGGRWNSPGLPAVYCASHLSLAVLEYFVHLPPELRRRDLLPLMTAVELRLDGGSVEAVGDDDLDRLDDLAWRRARGDGWLERGAALALAVPSVVVPREQNVILNPRHGEFGRVRVVEIFPFRFDPRMGV